MPSIYTFTQLTEELAETAIFTVPETVEPFAGEVIFTTELVGVGVGVGVEAPPLDTVTVTESCPITPLPLFAVTEMVCVPFATVVEFQLNVNGGDDVK